MVGLIKQVDAAVAADPEKKMKGFVAFLHEPDKSFRAKLRELAEKEKVALPLVVPVQQPPDGYPLAGEAYATVLVYKEHTVKQSFAFREKEIDAKAVAAVVDAAKRLNEGATEKR